MILRRAFEGHSGGLDAHNVDFRASGRRRFILPFGQSEVGTECAPPILATRELSR